MIAVVTQMTVASSSVTACTTGISLNVTDSCSNVPNPPIEKVVSTITVPEISEAISKPDDVIIGIVEERLAQADCACGWILDGMPRTIPQAEALAERGIEVDTALSIEIADETIVERMSGRRTCGVCGLLNPRPARYEAAVANDPT